MKTATKYMIAASLALTCLAGCGKEDTALELSDKEDVEPKAGRDYPSFSATIEGCGTRASETSWDVGDKIGISLSGSETFDNISYTTVNGDGNFTADVPEKQFIFQDDNPVDFIAYYPHSTPSTASGTTKGKIIYYTGTKEGNNDNSPFSQTEENQKTYDFLWADAKGSKSAPNVNFKFSHAMSKISFVFINGDEIDVSKITKYETSNFIVRGVFDPKTGKSAKYSGATAKKVFVNLENVKSGEEVTPLILIPQTLKSNTVTLTITVADANVGTITGNLVFKEAEIKAGNNYRFVIKVSKTRLSIGEVTIKPWGDPVDLGEKEAS